MLPLCKPPAATLEINELQRLTLGVFMCVHQRSAGEGRVSMMKPFPGCTTGLKIDSCHRGAVGTLVEDKKNEPTRA